MEADFNEPLRLRSSTNLQLWSKMSQLHYLDEEPKAKNIVDGQFVDIFINNSYKGVYHFTERLDRKQLKLVNEDDDQINGLLIEGVTWDGTWLNTITPYDNTSLQWQGFEYKFPESNIDWRPLHDFIENLINSNNNEADRIANSFFEYENLVDYFIFLNVLSADDNTGKNLYLARYDKDTPFFYVPWDLDGTLGNDFNGDRTDNNTSLQFNNMYGKLYYYNDGFRRALKSTWSNYRKDILQTDTLINFYLDRVNYHEVNGTYIRETTAWEDYTYNKDDVDYLTSWLTNRLDFLDQTFGALTTSVIEGEQIPKETTLSQNYPNPFNPTTTISYTLRESGLVRLNVYNLAGQLVSSLVNEIQSSGSYQYTFDASSLTSGLYLYRLTSKNTTVTKKMVLLK